MVYRWKNKFLLVASILGSSAGPALGALAGPVLKKIFDGGKGGDEGEMVRDKILLCWRVTPQCVTLPNGQSFVARCERASRKNLPRNVNIKKARQIGPKRQRKSKTQKSGRLLGDIVNLRTKALTSTGLLKKGLDIGLKAISSEIGKKNNRRRN